MTHVETSLLIYDQELREFHGEWLKREDKEQRKVVAVQEPQGERDEGTVPVEVPAEVETPVAFAPQDLPITIDIGIGIEHPSVHRGVGPPSDATTNDRITATSSPTSSISTMSDLTPTEIDGGTGEDDGEGMATRHGTFYLEDGNVEVVCGHTTFRIHSPIVSFSSPKLRDMLSPSSLLNAQMPYGCPRIVCEDSAEDFAVLLKMIYTPGCVSLPFDECSQLTVDW